MTRSIRDLSIAFAGICQAAALADQLASGSELDALALSSTINSVLKLNPESTIDVFGSLTELNTGLQAATDVLGQRGNRYVLKYVIQLIVLQKKLNSNKRLNDRLSTALEGLSSQMQQNSLDAKLLTPQLAEIYTSTISNLRPRILVRGEARILRQEQHIATIRCLLLGGIRAAVLWKQCGGGRLTLLLKRKQILTQLHYLLRE